MYFAAKRIASHLIEKSFELVAAVPRYKTYLAKIIFIAPIHEL
jgi:hypothetical protein